MCFLYAFDYQVYMTCLFVWHFNNMNITFYSFHFADEKNFTILSYRGLI